MFAGRDAELITVGEMPGVTVDDAVLFTGADRHELDMVFQFEHVGLDHGPSPSSTTCRSTWWRSRPRSRVADGPGRTGWNSLYLGNHDQPRSCPASATAGRPRVGPTSTALRVGDAAGDDPAPAPRDALRVPGRRDRHDNAGFTAIDQYRDIESRELVHGNVGRGRHPANACEALAVRSATTPGRPCSGTTRRPRAGSPTSNRGSAWARAGRGSPSRRTEPPGTARCTSTTAGSSRCATTPGPSGSATSPCSRRTTRRCGRSPGRSRTPRSRGWSSWRTCSSRMTLPDAVAERLGRCVLGNLGVPAPDDARSLQPWEARVHEDLG